jgi:hypothetical protein
MAPKYIINGKEIICLDVQVEAEEVIMLRRRESFFCNKLSLLDLKSGLGVKRIQDLKNDYKCSSSLPNLDCNNPILHGNISSVLEKALNISNNLYKTINSNVYDVDEIRSSCSNMSELSRQLKEISKDNAKEIMESFDKDSHIAVDFLIAAAGSVFLSLGVLISFNKWSPENANVYAITAGICSFSGAAIYSYERECNQAIYRINSLYDYSVDLCNSMDFFKNIDFDSI